VLVNVCDAGAVEDAMGRAKTWDGVDVRGCLIE